MTDTKLRQSSRCGTGAEQPTTEQIAEYVQFNPTGAQRAAKTRLQRAMRDNPLLDVSDMKGADLVRITGTPTIIEWSRRAGFMEWLTDQSEAAVKLENLVYKSLEALEDLISNDDPKAATARVNAVKIIMGLATHLMPRPENGKDKVANMSADELREFVRQNINLISE